MSARLRGDYLAAFYLIAFSMKFKTDYFVLGGATGHELHYFTTEKTRRTSLKAAQKLLAKARKDGFKGMFAFNDHWCKQIKRQSRHMYILKRTCKVIR